MTTAVYRDGILAADTAVFDRGCYCGQMHKIRRIGGKLIAAAGSLQGVLAFADWIGKGADDAKRPRLSEDFEAIAISADGAVMWYGHELLATEWSGPYFAIGGGFRIALGALAHGASAEEAVRICCMLDDSTREPIDVFSIASLRMVDPPIVRLA